MSMKYWIEKSGEFAADELEAGQYRYETEARRNQFPQAEEETAQEQTHVCGGCGGCMRGAENQNRSPLRPAPQSGKTEKGNVVNETTTDNVEQPYSDIAEYKMIFDPHDDDNVVGMNQS